MKLAELESKTQGSRPRTQKNPRPRTDFLWTDPLEFKDRNARRQGPRTQAQISSKKKGLCVKKLQIFCKISDALQKKRSS